jgi:SPP1 gp7 family putative phage head morphogenesis protein
MTAINLRHAVAQRPNRLRKRTRVLRGPKPSRANELWYKSKLLEIVRAMKAATEQELMPLIKQLSPLWSKDSVSVGDGYSGDLNDRINRLAAQFGGMRQRAKALAEMAARRSLDATDAQLITSIKKSVSVDVTGLLGNAAVSDIMERSIIANTELITSMPDQYLQRVRTAVFNGVQTGQRAEEIAQSLVEAGDVTESRANLIARDQTSKMNAAFNEARQTSLGIDSYMWAGAMDERERETHIANEGMVFRWDSPPATTGHPGDDINCRCTALPVFNLDEDN